MAFINHVFYPLDEVQVSSLEEDSIVTKAYNESSPGGFQIPIGDVIVQLFNKFKPNEYKRFSGLYESLLRTLYWKISVYRPQVKKQQTKATYDDVLHPEGSICVYCGLCNHCFESLFYIDTGKEDERQDIIP